MGRSFAARLILPLTLAAALIITGGLLIDYRLSRGRILANLDGDAERAMVAAARRIAEMSTGVESALRVLTPVIHDLPEGDALEDLLRGVIDSNRHIFGATVALNPERDRRAPYLYRSANALVQRDLAQAPTPYWDADWFTRARDLGRPTWVEPYVDRGGSEVLMITFAAPLSSSDGEFLAVVTADVALAELREYLEVLRIDSAGFGFLLTPRGTFIGSPTGGIVATPIAEAVQPLDSARRDSLSDLPAGLDGAGEDFAVRCPRDDGECRIRLRRAGDTGWGIGIVYSQEQLLRPLRDYETRVFTVGAAMLSLLVIAVGTIARRLTRPLVKLARASEAVARGQLDVPLPAPDSDDEVGQLLRAFDGMRRNLGDYIDQVEQSAALRSRMDGELNAAREIQMGMLPQGGTARVHGEQIDLWARVRPARAVGGDLYSFQRYADRLLFCIGDVSDKGVPAALFMARAISLIHQWEVQPSTVPPQIALHQLNDVLCRDNDRCMFLTTVLGVIDKRSMHLVFASAGHTAPLLLREGELCSVAQQAGPALGLQDGLHFPLNTLQLLPGDRLVLYTDGFDEARDGDHHMLGEASLRDLLLRLDDLPFEECGEALFAAVDAFTGDASQFDDMTLLLLEVRDSASRSRHAAQLTLGAGAEAPAVAVRWLQQQWETLALPAALLGDMMLVVEEIVCNVRDHSGAGDDAELTLCLECYRERIEIECSDPGRPCNPLEEAPRAELGRATLDAEIGGLGLHLITGLTDAQFYRREQGRNILRVRRQLVSPASPPLEQAPEYTMQLTITAGENSERDLLRLALDGALNTDTAPELEARLEAAIAGERQLVLLDMRHLEYISSAGLRVIFRAAKSLRSAGRSLAVANRQPQIEKVFEILQALPDMAVFSSEKELDDYLGAMQARVRDGGR